MVDNTILLAVHCAEILEGKTSSIGYSRIMESPLRGTQEQNGNKETRQPFPPAILYDTIRNQQLNFLPQLLIATTVASYSSILILKKEPSLSTPNP